jgi:ferredoxin hydrogenase gamma subunit
VQALYKDYLGRPYSEKAHYLLHTFYTDRKLEMTHTVNQIWNEITMSTMVY